MRRRSYTDTKVGVVGTINRDTIYHPDGRTVESWGGLLYSLKYLCESGASQVVPVVNVGADAYQEVSAILNRFDRIDAKYLRRLAQKNNHCFLHYANQSHKCEILKGGVPPLTYERLKPLADCDLVLVNFISGPDVRLSALEKFRENFCGVIYMDIHSLTLGRRRVRGGYRRHLRRPRYWRRYVACADILQVNKVEFELLSGRPFSPAEATAFFREELLFAKCLVITLGEEGCQIVYQRSGKTVGRHVEGIKVARVLDTTGCGDIFAAGFISEYLVTKNFIEAARRGNRLAAARIRLQGPIF